MNMPPYVMDLRIVQPDHRPIRLWLPLFLLWPFALVIVVLALVLTILTDVFLSLAGRPYHHYTPFLWGVLRTFNEIRGTTVHVRNPETLVDLVIK